MSKNIIFPFSILHIAECAGGVERYLQMLMPRLKAKGLRQYFICSKNYDIQSYSDMVDGVEQMDLKQTFSPFQVMKKVWQIRKQIKKFHPDIVYCHSSFAGGLGRLAAIRSGCKVVYNPHGWAFNIKQYMSVEGKRYQIIEKLLSPCTDKIVCISPFEKMNAEKEHIAQDDKLELIPSGIDIEKVRKAKAIARKDIGIADDAYVVGMVGRLCVTKAIDTFIHAAKLIHSKLPNSVFIIVGDGEERKETELFAKVNGLQLIVTGWIDNPYSYLKVFDVALLLSRWEGFGLAIVEYMAAEKNVIATKTGGIAYLIDDGVDGLFVQLDTPHDVCEKVMWLYNHPKEAAEMRKAALKKVYEKYDIRRVVDQHAEMFMNLCN